MSPTCIILFWETFGTVVCTTDICTKTITKKMVSVYHCPAGTRTVQLANVPLHLCTHHCVSEFRCYMLSNYVNKWLRYEMKICKEMVKDTAEICKKMVKDTQLMFSSIMLYERQNHECISWLPFPGNIPDGKRFLQRNAGHQIAIRSHYND